MRDSRRIFTTGQRGLLLRFAAAAYGLAVGISLLPHVLRPARPGQMPGFMASKGLDANASWYFMAAIVVITLAMPAVLRPLLDRLNRPESATWSRNLAIVAMFVPLWSVSMERAFLWVLVPTAIALAVCTALRTVAMDFSQRDVILAPTTLAIFLALCDRTEDFVHHMLLMALGGVLAVRFAIVFIRRSTGMEAPLCFALAPLALAAQSHLVAPESRYAGWVFIAWALITPFVVRAVIPGTRTWRRRTALFIAWLVYPVAIFGYSSATSLYTAERVFRANFFEDAQHLVAASEMRRGELPYRDIVPAHGLIQDALFDHVVLSRMGQPRIGAVLEARETTGAAGLTAIYAIAAAVTGSPHAALSVVLLGFGLGNGTLWVRFLPAMAGLAALVFALRTRRVWLLGLSGALVVLATLTGVEWGGYLFLTLVPMTLRFPDRRKALAALATGTVVAGVLAVAWMSFYGIFVPWLRVTLFDVLTVGPAYALDPITLPEGMKRFFPDLIVAVIERASIHYFVWIATLIACAALVSRERRPPRWRKRFSDPLLATAVFILLTGISYAERHHLYWATLTPVIIFGAAWRLWRGRAPVNRFAAIALFLILALAANLTVHFGISAWVRRHRAPLDPAEWVSLDMPRAGGALFRAPDASVINSIRRYVEGRLAPDETYFDFTNRGLTYFLLNRDCPVRNIEVGLYQSERLQREVVAALEANPKVRAAIVPPDINDVTGVDGVSNRVRAPLVWKYVEENFEPDWNEDGVVIWKRR